MFAFVEVENAIDPLLFNDNFFPKTVPGTTVPTNITSQDLGYPQGTHSNGQLIKGLRIPNNSKGYYQHKGGDVKVNTDNYALPEVLNKIEKVGKRWADLHPDLTPLKANLFTAGNQDNLYTEDGRPQVNGIRIGTGDFSRASGGPFYKLDINGNIVNDDDGAPIIEHNSHQNGLDVDVRYVKKDNTEGGVKVTESAYDRFLSNELVNLFLNEGGAVKVIVDYQSSITSDLYATNIIYDNNDDGRRDHIDHFHVAFANPNAPTGAINLITTQTQTAQNGDKQLTVASSQPIKDKYGKDLFDDFLVDVTTDVGVIYSMNNENLGQWAGIRVLAGKIQFILKVSGSGTAHIKSDTLNIYQQGHASGTAEITY